MPEAEFEAGVFVEIGKIVQGEAGEGEGFLGGGIVEGELFGGVIGEDFAEDVLE